MRLLYGLVAAFAAGAAVVMFCGFGGQITRGGDVPVIVTAAPTYDAAAAMHGAERFARGAQLLVIRNGKAELLVEGFAATADADVSFDAKNVLFAGKKDAEDAWAIWEVTLAQRSVRKVMSADGDLIRPLHLPDDRMVYAQRTQRGFQLATAKLDGAERSDLTYIPGSAVPADVLADGRILFESTYPLGAGSMPEMYLAYSDGSGVESYRCDHGVPRWGGRQLASGDVVFTHGATGLGRFTSALAAEGHVQAPTAEYAGGVVETAQGDWLVSARAGGEEHASLKLWRHGAAQLRPFFAREDQELVEPVLVKERQRPHRHPSALHDWSYGNLLALDARESREGDLKVSPAAVRMDTMDAAGNAVALGSAPVEPDGSFFVKAPADKPIRFALLDANGKVLREEHGWFWVRKGEQRICVGCHTGPERAAENKVPAVLLRSTTPVDLTGAAQPMIAETR
jgi:hypothetical protein